VLDGAQRLVPNLLWVGEELERRATMRGEGAEVQPRRLEDAVGHYYGELSPRERARLERHVRGCAVCQRAVAAAGVIPPVRGAVETNCGGVESRR
jgi:hypothetical protein